MPSKPTPSQRKAAAALGLTPKEQAKRWSTTSTQGPRLQETREAFGEMVLRVFPNAAPAFEYNMHGWVIPRGGPRIESWTGTMDPNFIRIFVAERKQGVTVHVWNPFEPGCLKAAEAELGEAGYKVMVGCLQYNRKGPVPTAALRPILESMAAHMKARR